MRDGSVTQTQASDALHMSQSAFSRRLLGYVEFRASEIEDLAKLLNVTITDLVTTEPTGASA